MTNKEAMYDQAVDFVADGDIDAAIGAYRQALELDDDFADAWEGLSMALADQEQYAAAIEAALRVVELTPEEQLAFTNLSRIYQRAGEIEKAEEWAAKARVLDWKRQLAESADEGDE